MKIIQLESVDSTHTFLKDLIKENGFDEPVAVVTQNQTNGIGSRGNGWTGIKGNLFFSFVLTKEHLPKDFKIQSASIFYSFLLRNVLHKMGSKVWIKWPNDFYINDNKIGGTITTLSGDLLYCGIGLNLVKVKCKDNESASAEFAKLDIDVDVNELLSEYFKLLKKDIAWKHIFSQFELEFDRSKNFKTTISDEKTSLKNAILLEDGAVLIENKKVYSLR